METYKTTLNSGTSVKFFVKENFSIAMIGTGKDKIALKLDNKLTQPTMGVNYVR